MGFALARHQRLVHLAKLSHVQGPQFSHADMLNGLVNVRQRNLIFLVFIKEASFAKDKQESEAIHIHKASFSRRLWAKMILTSSDVLGLSTALSWWERGEYFFSFIVAGACFGEYVADFKPSWYSTGNAERDAARKESISKISTLVLVAALVFELVCVFQSNALAGEVIGSINTLAKNAKSEAETAHNLAQGASNTAIPAKKTADAASLVARTAQQKSSNAFTLARGARREALALKAELADRTLSDAQISDIALKLVKYAGQSYDIIPYWDSPESVGIANRIQLALKRGAHWTYTPPSRFEAHLGGLVGIIVTVHPRASEFTQQAAGDLTLALKAEGLEAEETKENPNNPIENMIHVSVGSKR